MAERKNNRQSRRSFLKWAGLTGLGTALGTAWYLKQPRGQEQSATASTIEVSPAPAKTDLRDGMPYRALGRTGEMVSLLGIGGHHIGVASSQSESERIVHQAIDLGVNFMDNAWEYNGGRSEEWMGAALKGKRDKVFLMTKMCVHGGDAKKGMELLEESLKRLQTDHLDLWQIHEVANEGQVEKYFAPGGAVEALEKAVEQGKVRFTGFTGHRSPDVHLKMLSRGYPFHTCQMPLNPFDHGYENSFERKVLPELVKQNIGVIGMKSLAGNGRAVRDGVVSAAELLRYAMSLPVATVCSGIDSTDHLKANVAVAKAFRQMAPEELASLRSRLSEKAREKRFEYYKS